ncbi:MAG: GNAT family N-acetyltransferase [Pyrinomonadaceae bacterium]|nr:GNAT family N-acetyltransferase [Pyrinomonadaceae bacterium]
MMKTLTFKPATSVSLDELAAAFNHSFAGYFYPMQMNGEMLARRVRLEQLDLQNSLLAYQGEIFVGLWLFGMRGARGWCGGFGIVPEFRGRGCASLLMSEFLARARGCGVKKLSLEVLTRNTPAIRLYERAGMRVERDLIIFERTRKAEDSATAYPHDLKEAAPDALLRHFERLHAWKLGWQRQKISLLAADLLQGFYLGDKDAPDAYSLVVTRPDGITQVIDLAAANKDYAAALSARIATRCGALRVVNEPEESFFNHALRAHGFSEVDRQHEMVCEL